MVSNDQRARNRRLSALRQAGPWEADAPNPLRNGRVILRVHANFALDTDPGDGREADRLAARLIENPTLELFGHSHCNRVPFRTYVGIGTTALAERLEIDAAITESELVALERAAAS